ncbi:unnamed protein product [Diamesa serratosioi]
MEMLRNYQILNSKDHSIAQLPADVLKSVFYRLNGGSLLNCLAVCKSFSEIIESSENFMGKIRLNAYKSTSKNVKQLQHILVFTNRKYQHLTISKDKLLTLDYQYIKFNWKSIKVDKILFGNYLLSFLQQFTMNLTEIEFFDCKIESESHLREIVVYPKLKTLKINCEEAVACFIVLNFEKNIVNLEELLLPQTAFGVAHNIIRFRTLTFRLKKLHLTSPSGFQALDVISPLRSQRDYLEEIKLDILDNSSLHYIWGSMKRIKKVSLTDKCSFVQLDDLALDANVNIQELHINSKRMSLKMFEKILDATPELKILHINKMNKRFIEMCAEKLLQLEVLNVGYLKFNNRKGLKFRYLKQVTIHKYEKTRLGRIQNGCKIVKSYLFQK